MDHFFEVLRIIDGAINQDYSKVVAFAKSFASKLEEAGDMAAAKKVRAMLSQSKTLELTASRGTAINPIPVDTESKLSLATKEEFVDGEIALFHEDETTNKLNKFIKYIEKSNELALKGLELNPSLLLYGPPGCGKSETAKYIASKLHLPLVTARLDSLISSYLGSTSKNIRSLFNFADRERCVLFLDEFDAIAKIRDDSHELGELKRVVVSLLQNIDQLDDGTILIAATNHDHLLDSAVWRRFNYKLKIDLPGQNQREQLFETYLRGLSKSSDYTKFSELSEGLSGSDIKTICNELKRDAAVENKKSIEPASLIKEIIFQRFSSELQHKSQNDQMKFIRNKFGKNVTMDNIADMYGVSKGTVSNLLRELHESN